MNYSPLKACLLLAASFSFIAVNAQKKLKDGYIVLKTGDTIRGKIDYRNWEKNPAQIQFDNSQGVVNYRPADISYFEATGEDSYESHVITKDMRPLDINQLSDDQSDLLVMDTAFLRVLVTGSKVKLYEFVDFKPHFFIQQTGENKIEELSYKKYLNEKNGNLVEINSYRNQLTTLAIKLNASQDIPKKIEKISYKAQDLRSIARLLNGEDATVVKTTETKNFKTKKQLLIGGGVQFYSLRFTGSYEKYAGMEFGNGPGPVLNVAYDIFGGRNEQRWALRAELSFSQLKFKGTNVVDNILDFKKEYTYTLTQVNIIPGLAVMYHFVSAKKVRVYAGLGLGYAFSSYPTNTLRTKNLEYPSDITEEGDLTPENGWMMANAIIGTRINEKINIGLTTKLTGAFYNYSALGTKYFPVGLTVSYIFNTGKKRS